MDHSDTDIYDRPPIIQETYQSFWQIAEQQIGMPNYRKWP